MAEDLVADPSPPKWVVMEALLNCDALTGIYGNRYGWIDPETGLSPTEEEWDRTKELWKPIYPFLDRMQPVEPEAR